MAPLTYGIALNSAKNGIEQNNQTPDWNPFILLTVMAHNFTILFKSLMKDYQQKFLNSHQGTSVKNFGMISPPHDVFSSQCIPVKTFSGIKSLP